MIYELKVKGREKYNNLKRFFEGPIASYSISLYG